MGKTKFIERLELLPESVLQEGYITCSYNSRIINIGTAENRMMGDLLLPLFQNRPDMTLADVTDSASLDTLPLTTAVAKLYEDHFGIPTVDPSHILLSNGCSMLVERLSLVLCEPGDIILIPIPCYGCFVPDMFVSGATFEYIDLNNLPEKPPPRSRLLVLTSPGNPIAERIENADAILRWAYQSPDLHILVDDIYALSNRCGEKHQSIMGLTISDPERVHQMYGLSKDWGLAGIHLGFFY
jgi:aspartate/methionine/tyrosine aminotransferase